MSYLATGEDLKNYALFRVGEAADSAKWQAQAKTYVMDALNDVHRSAPFYFVLSNPPGVIELIASVSQTVITIGSNKVWQFSVAPGVSYAGRKIYLDDDQVVYRILSHTSGFSTFEVDAQWAEGTPSSGLSKTATIFQDEYSLAANCLRPWDGWVRNRPSETVNFITGRESNTRYPSRNGYTTKWTYTASLIQGAANAVQQVRVIPWPVEQMTWEYQYSMRAPQLTFDGVAATDTPLLPTQDLLVVGDRAAFYLAVDKNDDRANGYLEQSDRRLHDMVETYLPMQRPRFVPAHGSNLGVRV